MNLVCDKSIEIEELVVGDYMLEVVAEVRLHYTPGEPMVRYYPDGSGYPGSPPTLEGEVVKHTVLHVYGDGGEEVNVQLQTEDVLAAIYKRLDDDFLYDKFEYDIEAYLTGDV